MIFKSSSVKTCFLLSMFSSIVIPWGLGGCGGFRDPIECYEKIDKYEVTQLGIKVNYTKIDNKLISYENIDYYYTLMESCTGIYKNPPNIVFVPKMILGLYYGYWCNNRILIFVPGENFYVLKHEYIHYLLYDGTHKSVYFDLCL